MTIDGSMYIPTEEMDKAIRLRRKSALGQLNARATAAARGTRVVPPAAAPPAAVRVAYTCIMQSVYSPVTSYIHSTLFVSAFDVIVCTPSCCQLCVYQSPYTPLRYLGVDVDQAVLHTFEHRRLSVCRLYIISHITYCIYPMLYD